MSRPKPFPDHPQITADLHQALHTESNFSAAELNKRSDEQNQKVSGREHGSRKCVEGISASGRECRRRKERAVFPFGERYLQLIAHLESVGADDVVNRRLW